MEKIPSGYISISVHIRAGIVKFASQFFVPCSDSEVGHNSCYTKEQRFKCGLNCICDIKCGFLDMHCVKGATSEHCSRVLVFNKAARKCCADFIHEQNKY